MAGLCRRSLTLLANKLPSPYFLSKRSLHTSSNLALLNKNYMIPTIRVDPDINAVTKSLEKKVGLAPLFYQNAPVVLDFEATEGRLESRNLVTLFNGIHRLNLIPVGIIFTNDPLIQDLAKQYNIPFINTARASASAAPSLHSSQSTHTSQLPPQKVEKIQIRSFSTTMQAQPPSPSSSSSQRHEETLPKHHITSRSSSSQQLPSTHAPPSTSSISSPSLSSPPSPSPSPSSSSSTKQMSSTQPPPVTLSTTTDSSNGESFVPPLIIKASLRSGQQVYARNGADLIVMGSVHSGAEALADGNIHVYGALKGRALAGVSGNASAKIFSGKFHAELISIADTYCSCEEQPPGTDPNKPSVVWLEQGSLKFSTME